MTTTDETTIPTIPEEVREEVLGLIADLARTAGDPAATFGHLQNFCAGRTLANAAPALASALQVMFTECITYPLEVGDVAPVKLPQD